MLKEVKECCFTIDLESDHGLRNQDFFDILDNQRQEVIDFFVSLNIPFTIFATGEIIEKYAGFINDFTARTGSEVELHSYTHHTKNLTYAQEIDKAKEAYQKVFSRHPKGYRMPYGRVDKSVTDYLLENDFIYHSAVSPKDVYCKSKGVYSYKNNLTEVPVSRVLGIPYGQGFMNFFGKFFPHPFFEGRDFLLSYMHLHDFFYSEQVSKLPWYFRLFYINKQRDANSVRMEFASRITRLKEQGYTFITVSELLGR